MILELLIGNHILAGRRNRQLAERLIKQQEKQQRGVAACPYCGGGLPAIGVQKCMHCKSNLAWYENYLGKAGQESLLKERYLRDQKAIQEQINEQWKGAGDALKIFAIAIGFCLVFWALLMQGQAVMYTIVTVASASAVLFIGYVAIQNLNEKIKKLDTDIAYVLFGCAIFVIAAIGFMALVFNS